MDSNNRINIPEEDGIDIWELLHLLWDGRKTIIITSAIFLALGLIAALSMKRSYTCTSVMVPQYSARSSSSYSSLAALAGFDLGTYNMSSSDLSPLVYPQIVNSATFRRELINTPLHYAKADTAVSMYTYSKEYAKPSTIDNVVKYTIGLPKVILGWVKGIFTKEEPEEESISSDDENQVDAHNALKPINIPKDEEALIQAIGSSVSLDIDKKEGYMTLTVRGSEPLQTAELALKAQQLLQSEVTRFRTEKAQAQLEYVQARYDEIKEETESYQFQLATLKDKSKQITSARSALEKERLQQKYTISSTIFGEMAKQLETAKMQVKKDTPVLAVVQPVTVPHKPSNSRSRTLILWIFFGILIGGGIVFVKQVFPTFNNSSKATEETD